MTASNRPLEVDVLAREIWNRAAMAHGTRDIELALQVCAELGKIEQAYELRIKPGHEPAAERKGSTAGKFTGRPITSKYPGACRVCRHPYSIGDSVLWSKAGGCAHITCGELEAAR